MRTLAVCFLLLFTITMQPKSARTKLADTYITAIEENPFNLQKADAEF